MTGTGPTPPRTERHGDVDVRLDEDTRVAVVSFARGAANYLTYEFLDQVLEALEALHPPRCRAVVLRTDSKHFSAGADFTGERPSQPDGPHIFDLVPRLYRLPVPVVAVINGASIGAGLGLALAADFRVTSPSAYFLTNFNRIGLSPGFGLTLTLPRLVGRQRAAEMFYTARRIAGEEAVQFGLSDRLVDPAHLDETAISFAGEVAASAPRAVAQTRTALRSGLAEDLRTALVTERHEQAALIDSDEFKEGVRAWQEKRRPSFS